MKDWKGNKKSVFVTLGASNHSDGEREEHDYYATDPKAIELLLEKESFGCVWECASGGGHLSTVLDKKGLLERKSDIVDRTGDTEVYDFLTDFNTEWKGDIITNPPYRYAQEFVEKSIQIINNGNKVAMFLRLQFLEGKERRKLFNKYPPKKVYVASGRLVCAMNGDFEKNKSSATAYAWFVWEKGWNGLPTIEWIN